MAAVSTRYRLDARLVTTVSTRAAQLQYLRTDVCSEREEPSVLRLQATVHGFRNAARDRDEDDCAFIYAQVLHHPVREKDLKKQWQGRGERRNERTPPLLPQPDKRWLKREREGARAAFGSQDDGSGHRPGRPER